jgi:hypothetical protein
MNVNVIKELERILAQNKMGKGELAEKIGLRQNNFSAKLKSEAADSIFFGNCAEALGLPRNYFLTFADDSAPYLIPLYIQLIEEKDKRIEDKDKTIAILEETLELYRAMKKPKTS